MNVVEKINQLRKEKNAVILAHYYVRPEIQDIADFTGDSLALSQEAARTNADIIVFAGVHFMAETAKILSPDKKVLLPDLEAGCSLAESAPTGEFEQFVNEHPDHLVITYVNTTAEIKALSDITCTSSNAKQIVDSLPKDQKIIFAPDKNLGNYINNVTGRNMLLWNGECHVHDQFSLEGILKLKEEHPEAKILAHPECPKPILLVADHVGSTSSLLKFSQTDDNKEYIVVTESGILHEMKLKSPDKIFHVAPSNNTECMCSDCNFMKLNNLEKIYKCLNEEINEIKLSADLIEKAKKPIVKMLEISKKLGL